MSYLFEQTPQNVNYIYILSVQSCAKNSTLNDQADLLALILVIYWILSNEMLATKSNNKNSVQYDKFQLFQHYNAICGTYSQVKLRVDEQVKFRANG